MYNVHMYKYRKPQKSSPTHTLTYINKRIYTFTILFVAVKTNCGKPTLSWQKFWPKKK